MRTEYGIILIAIFVAFALSLILYALSYLLITKKQDVEKNSAYECGFDPFEDARNKFDVRFYLVAILFIIFDLEITFLFPWATVLNNLEIFGFWSMILFLFILTIGFIYEWKKGALDWE
uniref:NADH-ubiquinone oxidoreductase chain 3 n=1 Tax=Phalansterium sp. PJK-2012 TaxID=1267188 RepID=T1QE58_9EUKA|nr:NADH dehydrogenase subunit 3 [Phalansterium sp. PJK-2012]